MNIFSPGSKCRTPIFAADIDPYQGLAPGDDDPEYSPLPTLKRYDEYGTSSFSTFPGPLVKETLFNDTHTRDQPFVSTLLTSAPDTYSIATKRYSNASLYYRQYPESRSNGEAPNRRYNYIHLDLPEYFLLDTSRVSVNGIPKSKIVFRRMDGYDWGIHDVTRLQVHWHNYQEFRVGAIPGPLHQNAFCATWVAIYNLTTLTAIPVEIGDSQFWLTCRPWCQNPTIGPGDNDDGILSPLEWHIVWFNIDEAGYYFPKIFTPIAGYRWNDGQTKRADQWYPSFNRAGLFNPNDPGLGPTNAFGQREVPIINGEGNGNHGTLNVKGETRFLLTADSTNNPGESPLNSLSSENSYISVNP